MAQSSKIFIGIAVASLSLPAFGLEQTSPPGEMLAMGYDETYIPSDDINSRPWELGQSSPSFGWGIRDGRAGLLDRGRLLVVSAKGTVQVFVTPRTRFTQAGAPVASDHLLDGDLVRASYDIMGNTLIARDIEILEHAKPLPAPSTP
jgi:hypothetical protein